MFEIRGGVFFPPVRAFSVFPLLTANKGSFCSWSTCLCLHLGPKRKLCMFLYMPDVCAMYIYLYTYLGMYAVCIHIYAINVARHIQYVGILYIKLCPVFAHLAADSSGTCSHQGMERGVSVYFEL